MNIDGFEERAKEEGVRQQAAEVAAQLEEKGERQVAQIARILAALGIDFVRGVLTTATVQMSAGAGIHRFRRPAGPGSVQLPRTYGGVFFAACKDLGRALVSKADFYRVFYYDAPRERRRREARPTRLPKPKPAPRPAFRAAPAGGSRCAARRAAIAEVPVEQAPRRRRIVELV